MVIKPLTLWLLRNLTMRHGEFIWRTPYGEPVTSWPPALFSWRKHMKAKDSPDRERTARGKFLVIPIADIESSPTNPRKAFDQAELQELAESIKANGVLQNVIVRPMAGATTPPQMRYELVAGERRWRAAQLAGLDTIPATVRDLSDAQVIELQMIENVQRADLSPLEKARGYQRLLGLPEFKEEGVKLLAQKVGKSAATIYGLLKLLELPETARKAVEAGTLSMSTAQLIARVPNEKARKELAKEATTKRQWGEDYPSYREVKQTVQQNYMIELKQAPFAQTDETLAAAGSCERCPKRTGNDRVNYPEGRADVCTDPPCYHDKVRAHGKRELDAAKETGLPILAPKKGEELWSETRPGELHYSAPYIDLAHSSYETGNKKWSTILGAEGKAKAMLSVDGLGQVHQLVPKAWAEAQLRKGKRTGTVKRSRNDQERLNRDKKQKRQKELMRAALAELSQNVESDISALSGLANFTEMLRAIVIEAERQTWADATQFITKRLGLERYGMAAHIATLNAAQLMALWFELVAARMAIGCCGSYSGGPGKEEKAFFKLFDVDLDKLAKEDAKGKPSANGHAAKPAAMSAPLKAPALEYWEIRYHLKNIGTASILACGSYADACEFAARDPAFKKVASCEKITKEEMDRRLQKSCIIGQFQGKMKKLATCMPVELEGRKWCCLGSEHRYGVGKFKLAPLYSLSEWKTTFGGDVRTYRSPNWPGADAQGPAADLQRKRAYEGVLLTVRGETYVIGHGRREIVSNDPDYAGPPLDATSIDNADGDVARCCVCGCTEDSPCEGGCYWVEGDDMEDRCNRCVGKPIPRGEGEGREASKYDPTKDPHAPLALFALSKKAKAALKPLAAAGIVTKSSAIFLCARLKLEACAALATIAGVSRVAAQEIGERLKESLRELQEATS
jgi:ParB/RepB/Spo0J family partition protein